MSSKQLRFEDMLEDPWYSLLIDSLKQNLVDPLPVHVVNLLTEICSNSETRATQILQWVSNTNQIIGRMATGEANDSDFDLFWIRIWGIFSECLTEITKHNELYANINWLLPLKVAAEEFRELFSSDEKVFIEYMRHTNSHIHQDYIRSRPKIEKGHLVSLRAPKNPRAELIAENILKENELSQNKIEVPPVALTLS